MLCLNNITRHVDSHNSLQDISLELKRGQLNILLGPTLSGKTSLMRVMAGLDQPDSGELTFDGETVIGVPVQKRELAMVYQQFINYPSLSVYENIASPLRVAGLAKSEIEARVAQAAQLLKLEPYLTRKPANLSGGQQQRVALARALVKRASLVLLDEPLANLDYKLREALQLELRDLLHTSDLCVIYTTSDPRDAFALGDSVLLLADHALLQSGRPLEVYQQPASPAAADLMSDPGVNRLQTGSLVQVVRPEHLHLQQTDTDDVTFDVIVSGFETNGSETFLHCTVQGVDWVARLDGLRQFERGSHQRLHVSAASVHEFPATAERVETPDPGVLRHG